MTANRHLPIIRNILCPCKGHGISADQQRTGNTEQNLQTMFPPGSACLFQVFYPDRLTPGSFKGIRLLPIPVQPFLIRITFPHIKYLNTGVINRYFPKSSAASGPQPQFPALKSFQPQINPLTFSVPDLLNFLCPLPPRNFGFCFFKTIFPLYHLNPNLYRGIPLNKLQLIFAHMAGRFILI